MYNLVIAKAMVDTANIAVAKAKVGKDNRADIELIKGDLTCLALACTDVDTDINNGKYIVAKGKIDAIIKGTQDILIEIMNAK
jgi:Icc-related predicted phosphoesterase